MLSKTLESSLHKALALAKQHSHEYATLEHLLLAMVDDADAASVMRGCGVNLAELKQSLVHFIDNDLTSLVVKGLDEAKPTAGFQRVIHRAAIHVQSAGKNEVTGANVLVALFSERESHAVYFLQEQDINRLDVVNFISHGIVKYGDFMPLSGSARSDEEDEIPSSNHRHERIEDLGEPSSSKDGKKQEAITNYCVNLNKKSPAGQNGHPGWPRRRNRTHHPGSLPPHQE